MRPVTNKKTVNRKIKMDSSKRGLFDSEQCSTNDFDIDESSEHSSCDVYDDDDCLIFDPKLIRNE